MPPRSLTACSFLPLEGAAPPAVRQSRVIAPTVAHCVWFPAPRGGRPPAVRQSRFCGLDWHGNLFLRGVGV